MSTAPLDTKVAFRHLQKRVSLDKDVVTYRVLARELGITIAQSKSILDAFVKDAQQSTERGISAIYALSGILKSSEEEVREGKMDVEEEGGGGPSSSAPAVGGSVGRRGAQGGSKVIKKSLLLVPAADLDAKWKPPPVDNSSSYLSIVHPQGDRKLTDSSNKGKGKAVVVPPTTTAKAKSASTATATKAEGKATDSKPKIGGTTMAKGKGKEGVAAKPAARPIGALGGLFAKKTAPPPPPPPAPVPAVPAKRKASTDGPAKRNATTGTAAGTKAKPKVVAKSNGIFADEELESEEEEEEEQQEEEEGVDEEEAMREMEAEAMAQKKTTAAAAGKKATGAAGKKVETAAERRSREELEAMMAEDDEPMEVDPPKKPPVKKATALPAAKVEPKKPAAKTQGSINSFFKK